MNKIDCPRCDGDCEIINYDGEHIDCPTCEGIGKIDKPDNVWDYLQIQSDVMKWVDSKRGYDDNNPRAMVNMFTGIIRDARELYSSQALIDALERAAEVSKDLRDNPPNTYREWLVRKIELEDYGTYRTGLMHALDKYDKFSESEDNE